MVGGSQCSVLDFCETFFFLSKKVEFFFYFELKGDSLESVSERWKVFKNVLLRYEKVSTIVVLLYIY